MPERLYKTAQVNGNGPTAVTFLFAPVPMGSVWTGTIQILNSPFSTFHQALVGGIVWAEWTSYQPGPLIQAIYGEQVQVTSTGLVAGTSYQAILIGTSQDENDYLPEWPSNAIITPMASTLIGSIGGGGAGGTFGPVDVSQYGGITLEVGTLGLSGGTTGTITIQWLNSDGNFVSGGLRSFTFQNGMASQAVTFPNIGNQVQVTVSLNAGTAPTITLIGIPGPVTERWYNAATALSGQTEGMLLDAIASNISGITVTLGTATWVYQGPATLFVDSGNSSSWNIRFKFLSEAGTFDEKWRINQLDQTIQHAFYTVMLPARLLQVDFQAGGTQTVTPAIRVVPDLYRG